MGVVGRLTAQTLSRDGSMNETHEPTSSLGKYLHDTLLKDARENRQATEEKWNRNRAARYADASLDPTGTWKTTEKKRPGQSDTFFDTTKQKCVSGISLLTDSVFKDGRVPFMCSIEDEGAKTEAREGDPEAMDAGDDATEHAEARLTRQLRNCNAVEQFSKCIDDGATYGEYWTHTYSDKISSLHYQEIVPGIWDTIETSEDTRAVEWVTPWEMFRDMEVQDIHEGQYVIRCQQTSCYDLRGMLSSSDIMIPRNIKRVLQKHSKDNAGVSTEYDNTSSLPPRLRNITNRKKDIGLAEFWCLAPREKVEAFRVELSRITGDEADDISEPPAEDEEGLPGRLVPAFVIMADEEIIAFEEDPGKTPFERGEFEPNNDNADGIGIADNMESCQKVLNGAIRSYEDNTKLIANFIILIRRELLKDVPEENWFEGGMIGVDLDEGENIREAMEQMRFTDITGSLQKLIEMYLEFSDMASHVPRAEQGHQNANAQTAFELQQRLEKAGKYLGNVIHRLDEVMRRVVAEFHDYNMNNPDIQDGKGDFSIITLGFDSFQNRYIRLQKLMQFLNLILSNDELTKRAKLRYILSELAKAQDMEPDQVWKSNEEMQSEDEQRMQSMESQIQLARMQLELEEIKAKTGKDDAATQKLLADIEAKREELRIEQDKLDLERERVANDRVKVVADVEDKVEKRSTNQAPRAQEGRG